MTFTKHLATGTHITTMACSGGFPLRVKQSSSESESITLVSESISVCDSLCGYILSVSHLDKQNCISRNTKRVSLFFFRYPLFGQDSSPN